MALLPTQSEMEAALAARIGESLQSRFTKAVVAICGLGGLGSNIAVSLVRAGIGKLILIDFDCVDLSNLNRQQYKATQIGIPKPDALAANLQEIAPYAVLVTHCVRLDTENCLPLLSEADVVCEAFDEAEAKAMLVDTVLEQLPNTPIVAASGMAGLASPNRIATKRIGKRLYLCGDGISDIATAGTLFAPRVMLCAAHQALTVLRLLAGEFAA